MDGLLFEVGLMREIKILDDFERVEMMKKPFLKRRKCCAVSVAVFNLEKYIGFFGELHDCRMQRRYFLPDKIAVAFEERFLQIEKLF